MSSSFIQKKEENATMSHQRMHPNASPNAHRILPLSAEAISQIHSSKHITSLQGVILSLLENSLDANATKINITVDWRRGGCTVEDDGTGIPASEFAENGGLGRMYCTSKRSPIGSGPAPANETHGSNGTFLAELAAMSLLSITSAQNLGKCSANLTLHQGKIIARRIDDSHTFDEFNYSQHTGTDITVRDLFGNMPVRVKQRALNTENGAGEDQSWHDLKHSIVGLLLAWPKPCAVKLKDANKEDRTLNIAGQHPNVSVSLTSKSLNQLAGKAAKYDLRDVLPVLFQSGLAPAESRPRWIPLSASTSTASLKGLVCLDPAPSRHCQFVAIGIHPCSPLSGQNELYEIVNKIFLNSDFGVVEDNASKDAGDVPAAGYRGGQALSKQVLPRKGIDRFPMYYIQLRLDRGRGQSSDPDHINETALKALTDVLEAAVFAWLERNHFRPKKRRRRGQPTQRSAAPPMTSSSRPNPVAGNQSVPARDSTDERAPTPLHDKKLKRRKIIDLTGDLPRNESENDPSTFRNYDIEFGNLSGIRIGQIVGEGVRPVEREPARLGLEQMTSGDAVYQGLSARPSFQDVPTYRSDLNDHTVEALTDDLATTEEPLHPMPSRTTDEEQIISSEDFGSIEDAEMIAASEAVDMGENSPARHEVECEDGTVTWVDPITKQPYRVNSRTGVVLPAVSSRATTGDVRDAVPSRQRAGIDTTLSSAGRPISLARRNALATKDGANGGTSEIKKVPDALRGWSNPVFSRQEEEPIAVASAHGPGVLGTDENSRCCIPNGSKAHFTSHSAQSNGGIKLSRAALKHATVIRQVDKKFILCKIPSIVEDGEFSPKSHDAKQMLVLIDQHAASERTILEALLASLCTEDGDTRLVTIQTASLSSQTVRAKPFVFEISEREYELFSRYRGHFETWGMIYDVLSKPSSTSGTSQLTKPEHRVVVKNLPAVIAERCANLPSLCIEMLRTELWELADGTKRPVTSLRTSMFREKEAGSPSWLSILPLLPTGLRDMLHSRSCRSAIMFNDVLSLAQCEKLLMDLSRCIFPFICAHGRTGMVPLAELDPEQEFVTWTSSKKENNMSREKICDAGSLAKWMASRRSEAKLSE